MPGPATATAAAKDPARGRLRLPAPGNGAATVPPGRSIVHLDGAPVGLWYVPRTEAERLVILLHGAGGSAQDALRLLLPYADGHRLMLFAPQSLRATWDMISGGYGPARAIRGSRRSNPATYTGLLEPIRKALGWLSTL